MAFYLVSFGLWQILRPSSIVKFCVLKTVVVCINNNVIITIFVKCVLIIVFHTRNLLTAREVLY